MKNKEYATNDIYLGSYLMSDGRFKLKEVRGIGNGKKVFLFEPVPDETTILGFYNGQAKVSALKVLESFQSLKAATYVLGIKKEVGNVL